MTCDGVRVSGCERVRASGLRHARGWGTAAWGVRGQFGAGAADIHTPLCQGAHTEVLQRPESRRQDVRTSAYRSSTPLHDDAAVLPSGMSGANLLGGRVGTLLRRYVGTAGLRPRYGVVWIAVYAHRRARELEASEFADQRGGPTRTLTVRRSEPADAKVPGSTGRRS